MDNLYCFSNDTVSRDIQEIKITTFMGVCRGPKRVCTPLGIGFKNQKILENLKSASRFRLIDLILATTLYLPVWHSHCTKAAASLFWCDAVMSLQFTHVYSFTCRFTLRNLRALRSTLSLICVKITWQRIFKGSLQVVIINAFFCMWFLTADIFGRWCSDTVTADNDKQWCRSKQIFGGAKNFCPNFWKLARKKLHKKKWPPKKSFPVFLGAIFAQIFKVLLRFSEILWKFSKICPNFFQIKTLWGAIAPPAHPPRTPVTSRRIVL